MIKTTILLILLAFVSCRSTEDKIAPAEQVTTSETTVIEQVTETNTVSSIAPETPDKEVPDTPKKETEQDQQADKTAPVVPKEIPVVVKKTSKILFDEAVYPFGNVIEGDLVKHVFTFKNAGDSDLLLKNVIVDCGCTTPEYTKEAIAPGTSGEISIVFDTHGKLGSQSRLITVVTNGDPVSRILKLEGIVRTD
ncbi:MAG: DUF1573 domain-containing protein [Bacteroidetes bacterium]|nr:DUF1573 domain-containing protein [Bacteroidota bacterium]